MTESWEQDPYAPSTKGLRQEIGDAENLSAFAESYNITLFNDGQLSEDEAGEAIKKIAVDMQQLGADSREKLERASKVKWNQ